MAFDKKYPNRKDKRKPYIDSREVDATCRSHGSCPYCAENRKINEKKKKKSADEKLKEAKDE